MTDMEAALAGLEEERDALRRELIGTQEMLGFVLLAVGSPVQVTKEFIQNGIPQGAQIRIDESEENNAFIFSVEVPDDDPV